jgi:hypothetical protein
MKISKPEIRQQENQLLSTVQVESLDGSSTLWYSVEKKFGDLLTDFSDAPLVALLIPAMANGEDIHILGTISERLFYNLSGPYQQFLQCFFPALRRVNIRPENVQTRDQRASGVATGFSGGIDSYCLLADHHYSRNVPEGFRISHLLFGNVGSHGQGEEAERVFRERYTHLEPVAERIGLPFITVNSNLDSFYIKGLGFVRTIAHRNATLPLLLQGGIGRCMYASAIDFKEVARGDPHNANYYELIIFPLLSTEVLDLFSVGSEYTRVEKTMRVAEIPDSYSTLNVCFSRDTPENCSTCSKCMRTLLTLEIAGLIDLYSASFDLNAYRRRRNKYIRSIFGGHGPFNRDIIQFARERGFSFPFRLKVLARLEHLAENIQRLLIRTASKLKRAILGGR